MLFQSGTSNVSKSATRALRAWMALGVLACMCTAVADDAAISYGGNPKLLKGHPTVQMAREKVVIRILPKTILVDCTFVFKNHGAACDVRIGFPDRGIGEFETSYLDESDQGNKSAHGKPPFKSLANFRTYVDGKPAAITLLKDGDTASSWHTKEVKFEANQTRIVRDTYEVPQSGGIEMAGGFLRCCHYILSTGASWKGDIGLVEVVVQVDPKAVKGPLKLVPVSSLGVGDGFAYPKWKALPKNTILYSALCKPKVSGNTLRFTKKNVKPKDSDDVRLYFGHIHGQG